MVDDPVYVVGLVNSCVVCMRHRCFSSSQMAAVSDGRRQTERDLKCDFLGLKPGHIWLFSCGWIQNASRNNLFKGPVWSILKGFIESKNNVFLFANNEHQYLYKEQVHF